MLITTKTYRMICGHSFLAMKPAIPDLQPNFRASYCILSKRAARKSNPHRSCSQDSLSHAESFALQTGVSTDFDRGILTFSG